MHWLLPVVLPGCIWFLQYWVLDQAMQWLFQPLPGATTNVVLYCGATPVFADVNRSTYNIDPPEVSGKLASCTKAVIAVDLFGLCANIESLRQCASSSSDHGISVGGLGNAAAFALSRVVLLWNVKHGLSSTIGNLQIHPGYKYSLLKNSTHSWPAFVTYIDPKRYTMSHRNIIEQLQYYVILTWHGTYSLYIILWLFEA
jgi:hypothetical protein